jgi:hypothetical protein
MPTRVMPTEGVTRRTALKGLGVSLGLPWLESLQPRQALAASDSQHPRRMAFLFVPNGVHMPDWTPERENYGFSLPYILEPLGAVQDDLLVLSGLTHDKGRANGDGPGDHARSASVFLTGAQPRKTAGANIRSGVSVDQFAARAISGVTKFSSLELGCEEGRGAGNCDSGYSCAYSSNISWAAEDRPVGKEINPRLVFERLFGSDTPEESRTARERRARKKSVLDFIYEDARRLRRQMGGSDRRKLDEYLTGVREVEQRIARADGEGERAVGQGPEGPAGIPDEYGEHIRLMCDMIVLAFQSDQTRLATFMLANAGSNRSYTPIGVPDGHHSLSHHRGDPKKHAKIREINRFHVSQLAYLLGKLKAVPEGEGTLLDNSMIVYGSGLSDGNRHNNENLPVLLAGRGGGTIDTGRHVRYEEEIPLTNLYLSMLDRFGTPAEFIGDSTGRLRSLKI